MKVENAIAQRHHIFNYNFSLTPIINQYEKSSNPNLYEALNNTTNKKYLLLKSTSTFATEEQKYLFIQHAERATELIHPVLLPLLGFSDTTPDLYFDHYPGLNSPITDEQLQNLDTRSIQIIFLGILSGLSYLLSKGYSISNFSLNSIFFSEESGPKFINYINYNLLDMNYALNKITEKCNEKELVFQVGQVMREFVCHKRKQDGEDELRLPNGLNPTLCQYILSCNNLAEDRPSLSDLFKSLSSLFKNDPIIKRYLYKLDSADKYRYDYRMDQENYIPFRILKDDKNFYYSNTYFDYDVNILHSCYIQDNVFTHKEYFPLLNRLPDSEIKLLLENQANPPKQLYEFLCYEKEYLLLPKYKNLFQTNKPENNYLIYQKLIEKNKSDNEPCHAINPIALRHLKTAAKKNHKESKIKLALHYLKGDIVPSNFEKSLHWLKSVSFENQEDASSYINLINSKMKELDEKIENLGPDQKNIIKNADDGKLLDMLYVAFAFYSGINDFPIYPSKSIYYYRQAAKKSANCMCLLGGLYLQGYIFPRNLIRARNCFEKAALNGSIKAKILDSMIRKHPWRLYLSDVSIQTIYNTYIQCPESLSFDDTLIFPEINFLIQNQQNHLLQTSPYLSSFYFYDQRNEFHEIVKKNEKKLSMSSIDFRVPTISDKDMDIEDIKILQLYSYIHTINKLIKSNILPQQLEPVFYEVKKSLVLEISKKIIGTTFGFFFEDEVNDTTNNDEDDSDITKQNRKKYNISSDMESKLLSFIQNKYIPVDITEDDFNCSTVSYIPQLSLPVADDRLKKLKKVVDDSFEKILPRILENDKDKYLVSHINIESKSIENYLENLETILRTTIKEHMPCNKVFQSFITNINKFDISYSEPIFYSSLIDNVNEDDTKTQLFIAESYFNGENGFPVNYTEAAKYYKMAADKGNSEAQWKYGQLKINGLGTIQDGKEAYLQMKKSAEQKNPEGMLRYGLFIRHFLINHGTRESVEWPSFQQYLEESANSGNIEAIHQLGMILESNYSYKEGTAKSVIRYEEAVEKGLIEAVYRLIHIYDNPVNKKKYKKIVKMSIGICDHDITMRLIHIFNHKKLYDQSGRLIKVGFVFDKDAFLPNYAKHMVFHTNNESLHQRIASAISLLKPTIENPSQSIIQRGYLETYLMAMLTILNKANEYEKACQLFIENMNCLTMKSKKEFVDFYMHVNKKVARQYQLSINSYLPEYRACVDSFLLIKKKGPYVRKGDEKLKVILQENSNNQFALLKRGKILLKNHLFMRRNVTKAFDFIQKAAKQNCPEACFEYGKELYYGRTIPMNRWKAFKYFKKSFDQSNRDPRAGYFLSKKCFIQRNLITQNDADSSLKVAVKSGYRRALFKLGKRFFYGKGNKSELGIILIKKARDQQYSKSIDFLDQYENSISEDAIQENEQMAYFAFAKELYHGTVIAQDLMMSFSLFMKFFKSKEPDLRAGYYLSKKKYIQMELITPEQARNALVISAKSGYKCAQFRLGKLYYLYEGKKEKGINLIKKAKKQNFKKAIEFLKKIKNQQVKLKSEEDFRNIIPRKQQQQEQPEEVFGNIIPLKQQQPEEKFGNNNNNNDNNNNNENNSINVNNNNNDNNNNGDNIALAEIKVNDGVDNTNVNKKHLINAHKSVTSSNINIPKLNNTAKPWHTSSRLMKTSGINEPLLSDFNEKDDNEANPSWVIEENDGKKTKYNLDDPVSSDFSDEPPDEDDI